MTLQTPDSLAPGEFITRRVSIPADPVFLEAVGGALSSLAFKSSWEQGGTMTPDEAAQLMKRMYLDWLMSELDYVGTLVQYVTQQPPPNVLPCDGSSYSRADYPALYARLDGQYILTADTFVTPDLRGRFMVGSGAGAEHTYALGDLGGADEIGLTEAQLPAHSHGTQPHNHTDLGHSHTYNNSAGITLPVISPGEALALAPNFLPGLTNVASANIQPAGVTVDATGGDEMHENRPPFYAVYIGVVAK